MPKQTEHAYDVLIVGSSLGGLSAGAIMANRGYRAEAERGHLCRRSAGAERR